MARSFVIPAGYNDAIDAAATRNGLNPDFLRGTIARESAFDPKAVSKTGALGLGQVLPSTAARPGYGVAPLANPYDPVANINFSAAYLAARGTKGYSGGEYSSVTPIGRDGLPSGGATSLGTGGAGTADPFAGAGNVPGNTTTAVPINSPATLGAGNTAPDNPEFPGVNLPGAAPAPPAAGLTPTGNPNAGGMWHDWFRRIAIALLGIIFIAFAIAAFTSKEALQVYQKYKP